MFLQEDTTAFRVFNGEGDGIGVLPLIIMLGIILLIGIAKVFTPFGRIS